MVVAPEVQKVEQKRPAAETIEIPVPCAPECAAVAETLGIPVRAVRDVVAAFGADVLKRKIVGQVGRIYAAHVNGLLPAQTEKPKPITADTGEAAR